MRAGFPGRMRASLQVFSTPAAPIAAPGIVESIQQIEFTIASSATTGTATISSVTTANTALFYSYQSFGGKRQTDITNSVDDTHVRVTLTDATTVTAVRNTGAAFAITVICTVVEYKSTAIESIQQGTITMTTTNVSATDTISSVTTANSVVVHNGQSSVNSTISYGQSALDVALTNATTVTATRDVATSTTTIVNYVVIEFASGIVSSVQEFAITITDSGAVTATATISSVDTSRSAIFPGGYKTNDAGGVAQDDSNCHVQLTNATTVTATRNATATEQPAISGTVVEFASGKLSSVQRGVDTVAGVSLTKDVTVSAIVVANSVVNALCATSTSTASIDSEEQTFTIEIIDTTTIRVTRNVTGRDIIFSWELVEYA